MIRLLTGIFPREEVIMRSGKSPRFFLFRAPALALALGLICLCACRADRPAAPAAGGVLESLARPHHGRSMRATSTTSFRL